MVTQENFEIKLPLFEGPFDLLLFFIERDELQNHGRFSYIRAPDGAPEY